MADHLMAKVRQDGKSIRTLTVKVRYNDMEEDECSESLIEPTDLETDVYDRISGMLRRAWKRRVSLRLVSLKLSNVYEGTMRIELPLERASQQHTARQQLARVVDELRRGRGYGFILRGHDFRLLNPPLVQPVQPAAGVDRARRRAPLGGTSAKMPVRYVPLNVRSYYSFLNSTLSIDAIISLAKRYELPAIALADEGNLHGAVEFAAAARHAGIKPIIGVRIQVSNDPVLLLVESVRGYHNLCRLLSSQRKPIKQDAETLHESESVAAQELRPFRWTDLDGLTAGLVAVSAEDRLAQLFPGRFYRAVTRTKNERKQPPSSFPSVACPPIRYAAAADRLKFNIVQSIRTRTLLAQEHPGKQLTGD
jgi:hypothetical protein